MNESKAEAKSQEKRADLSTRSIVLWGAGMLVVLGLAVLVGSVAISVWQTQRILRTAFQEDVFFSFQRNDQGKAAAERLGGEVRAVKRLVFYIHLPDCIAPEASTAYALLGHCGEPGMHALIAMIEDRDRGWAYRARAAHALADTGTRAVEATLALQAALEETERELSKEGYGEEMVVVRTSLRVALIDLRARRDPQQ